MMRMVGYSSQSDPNIPEERTTWNNKKIINA